MKHADLKSQHRSLYSFKVCTILSALFLCLPPAFAAGAPRSVSKAGVASALFSNTIAETSAIITNTMAQKNIVGLSIALVQGTNIVWSQGFGYADRERGIPAAATTVYMLGSISKTLTSALLMNQLDRGLVSLDACVTNYIPEFSMLPRFPGGVTNITVRRLLNHHSGVPGDIYNDMFIYGSYRHGFEEWLIDYLKNDYPAHEPGKVGAYSNSGFVLAGEVAARVANADLNDIILSGLFLPLGMNATAFTPITNNLAMGYVQDSPTPATIALAPATGGAYTTVEDMSQFIMMLLGGGKHPNGTRIMESNTLYEAMAVTERSPLDIGAFFVPGLGLDSVDDAVMRYAGRTWFKDGGTGNFHTFMEVLPDGHLGVIVMVNTDTGSNVKYTIGRECLKRAIVEQGGPQPTLPPLPAPVSVTNRSEIAGTYVKSSGFDDIAANPDGTLTWTKNVHNNPTNVTLVYTNGAFFMSGGTNVWWAFTNTAFNGSNYFLMVQYGSTGSEPEETVMGGYVIMISATKYTPTPISEAWSNRLSKTYVYSNVAYDDGVWYGELTASFTTTNGVLLMADSTVLDPVQADLAFIPEISSRKDGCLRIVVTNNAEQILFGGWREIEKALIPDLALRGSTNGHLRYHDNDWYRFTPAADTEYVFTAADADATNRIALVLCNEAVVLVTNAENTLCWRSSSTSPVYLALAPVADADYTLSVTTRSQRNDYNGDGRSDLAVFDNVSGGWYITSVSGSVLGWNERWGWQGAVTVPGDYDGDGSDDLAVFDSTSGNWYIRSLAGTPIAWQVQWGWAGAVPVSGDYDGDGIGDLAVFDSASGYWYIRSVSGTLIAWQVQWGWPGALPVPGDYTGDGSDDLAVFDSSSGYWYIRSVSGTLVAWRVQWGWAGAVPVPGDYNGDGIGDLAVFDSASGKWYVGTLQGTPLVWASQWGWPGAVPVPGDYDGNGIDDLAVFDSTSGNWYIGKVTGETIAWATRWGWTGAVAVGTAR